MMILTMKSKKTSHSRSRSKARAKSRSTKKPVSKTSRHSHIETPFSPTVTADPLLKTCQEVEVGDIGGFGSTVELEEHEKRCNDPATEFCVSCGKNLCHNHYDLLHRDHNNTGQSTSTSIA